MPYVHPVKVELAKRGQTQKEFASKVGVSPGSLTLVLNGRLASWPALRRRVADALEVSESDLFPEAVAS
jgi:transcriptional regulator with XRE-family HTH domain